MTFIDWFVLDRYFSGESSAEERAVVERWLAAHPDGARVDALLRAASDGRRARRHDVVARESVADGVMAKVREARMPGMATADGRPMARMPKRAGFGGQALRGVASLGRQTLRRTVILSAIAATGIALFITGGGLRSTNLAADPSHQRTYNTTIGQRGTLTLRDGTRVTLAPRTTLTVDSDFGTTTRGVSVIGEAFFTVTTQATTPFTVRSGNVTTRVLGTAFDVMYYPGDRAVRVIVVSGKVQTQRAGRPPVILRDGMMGRIADSTTILTGSDVASYIGWISGRLDLRDTPVSELVASVERWYGIRFRFADSSLRNERVNGRITFGTPADVLTKLRAILDVATTVQQQGDTTIVTLHARQPIQRSSPVRRDEQNFLSHKEIGR